MALFKSKKETPVETVVREVAENLAVKNTSIERAIFYLSDLEKEYHYFGSDGAQTPERLKTEFTAFANAINRLPNAYCGWSRALDAAEGHVETTGIERVCAMHKALAHDRKYGDPAANSLFFTVKTATQQSLKGDKIVSLFPKVRDEFQKMLGAINHPQVWIAACCGSEGPEAAVYAMRCVFAFDKADATPRNDDFTASVKIAAQHEGWLPETFHFEPCAEPLRKKFDAFLKEQHNPLIWAAAYSGTTSREKEAVYAAQTVLSCSAWGLRGNNKFFKDALYLAVKRFPRLNGENGALKQEILDRAAQANHPNLWRAMALGERDPAVQASYHVKEVLSYDALPLTADNKKGLEKALVSVGETLPKISTVERINARQAIADMLEKKEAVGLLDFAARNMGQEDKPVFWGAIANIVYREKLKLMSKTPYPWVANRPKGSKCRYGAAAPENASFK